MLILKQILEKNHYWAKSTKIRPSYGTKEGGRSKTYSWEPNYEKGYFKHALGSRVGILHFPFLPLLACIASVSSRSSTKLGREQKNQEWGGGGRELRKRLPANPTILKSVSSPSPFLFFFCSRYTYTLQLYRVHDVFQREMSVQFGGDCAYSKRLLRRLFPFPSERLPRRLRRYWLTFTCKEFLIFNFHMLHCYLLSSYARLFIHSFVLIPKQKMQTPILS